MKSVGLVTPLLATAAVAARYPRDVAAGLYGRQVIDPRVPTDTVSLQPVYYSEFIPYPTVIDPFRDGHPIAITACPTTVVIASTLTSTIIGPLPSDCTVSGATSSSTSGSASPILTGTTSETASSVTDTTSTVSGTASPVTGTGSSTSATATITAPATPPVIGDGIPRGIVTNLPTESFIYLAFTSLPFNKKAKRADEKRQVLPGQTASPISVVDLTPGPTGLPQYALRSEDCDDATPLILSAGSLVHFDTAVAKQNLALEAVLGILLEPSGNEVNKSFALNNGVLSWLASDATGVASFFSCPDGLYAGFPTYGADGCREVVIGAILGAECSSYVASTAPVNPTFTPPISGFTTSPASSATTAATFTTDITATVTSSDDGSSTATSVSSDDGSSTATASTTEGASTSTSTEGGDGSSTTPATASTDDTSSTESSGSSTTQDSSATGTASTSTDDGSPTATASSSSEAGSSTTDSSTPSSTEDTSSTVTASTSSDDGSSTATESTSSEAGSSTTGSSIVTSTEDSSSTASSLTTSEGGSSTASGDSTASGSTSTTAEESSTSVSATETESATSEATSATASETATVDTTGTSETTSATASETATVDTTGTSETTSATASETATESTTGTTETTTSDVPTTTASPTASSVPCLNVLPDACLSVLTVDDAILPGQGIDCVDPTLTSLQVFDETTFDQANSCVNLLFFDALFDPDNARINYLNCVGPLVLCPGAPIIPPATTTTTTAPATTTATTTSSPTPTLADCVDELPPLCQGIAGTLAPLVADAAQLCEFALTSTGQFTALTLSEINNCVTNVNPLDPDTGEAFESCVVNAGVLCAT